MTTTLLKGVAQFRVHINVRDLKPYRFKHSHETTKNNTFIRKVVFFFAVVLAHILIALIVFKLSTVLPTPPVPEQAMMVSLLEDAPIAPLVEQVSANPKPQHIEQKPVVKPQTKPATKAETQQSSLPETQEPATQIVNHETKPAQENSPPQPTHTEIAEAKTVTESTQKATKEAEVKEDVKQDVIEPPRFGVAYLNNPKPNYPNLSRRAGEQGRVLFKVLVSESGEPASVEISKSSGFERLDQAGLEAVKQWRFVPAKKNNQAISAYVMVPVSFSLEK